MERFLIQIRKNKKLRKNKKSIKIKYNLNVYIHYFISLLTVL